MTDVTTATISYVERLAKVLPPNAKAFLVDDSVPTRRIFRTFLTELGFAVEEAINGLQALEKLEVFGPGCFHIIFSDISMPKMDGFEFCHRLQQEAWFDHAPFVLVSTESDARNVIKGLKLGADDFVSKPFNKEILAQVIERALKRPA